MKVYITHSIWWELLHGSLQSNESTRLYLETLIQKNTRLCTGSLSLYSILEKSPAFRLEEQKIFLHQIERACEAVLPLDSEDLQIYSRLIQEYANPPLLRIDPVTDLRLGLMEVSVGIHHRLDEVLFTQGTSPIPLRNPWIKIQEIDVGL